jgi:MoxR-like ATPase
MNTPPDLPPAIPAPLSAVPAHVHSPLAGVFERVNAVRGQISQAFVGQAEVLDQLLIALLAGGHVLLEGVPGLGKTLLVRSLATAMECSFARIQFTPDLMPSDVSGHSFYDPKSESFKIRRGPVFTNLLLADEINRAPAKTQSALLEVMQEQQVTIESHSFKLSPPFMTVATQNPVEQEGTYPLPEAQLDRFLLKILMNYPSLKDEVDMVSAVTIGRSSSDFDLSRVRAVVKPEEILAMQAAVAQVRMDPVVLDYAVRIARATREFPGITLGSGPRGGLSLVRAARAQAVIESRDFVTPDDVKSIAKPALRHRVTLAPEMQIEGRRIDDVLDAMLSKIEAPRR